MTIGLISDTHGTIAQGVFRLFDGVDAILHAGDWGDYGLMPELEALAPLYSIRGNVDEPTKRVPETLLAEVGGIRAFITHKFEAEAAVAKRYAKHNPSVDLLLFGHTHRTYVKRVAGLIAVNPGSPTKPRGGPPSAGLLAISDGKLSVTIHDVSDRSLPIIASA